MRVSEARNEVSEAHYEVSTQETSLFNKLSFKSLTDLVMF